MGKLGAQKAGGEETRGSPTATLVHGTSKLTFCVHGL